MKKINLSIICLLFWGLFAQAQEETKITNLISQLPAQTFEQLNLTMAKLADLKETDLIDFVAKLSLGEEGDNTKEEYALSGLTGYVSSPDKESLRKKVGLVYAKALMKNKSVEARRFILNQMQNIADDASIPYVTPLLFDSQLAAPASLVLVGIGSEAAKAALEKALGDSNADNTLFLLEAVAYLKDEKSRDLVTPYAKSENENIRKTAYFALASIADPHSADLLRKAADASDFRFDKDQAFEYYLSYIRNLKEKDGVFAGELANALMQKMAGRESSSRIAVLTLMCDLHEEKSLALLETALKDSDRSYRLNALQLAIPYMIPSYSDFWIKLLRDGQPDLKIAIMRNLGSKEMALTLPAIKELMNSSNMEVKKAAIFAAGQLGKDSILPEFLAILKKGEAEEIAVVKRALLTMMNKDVSAALTAALPTLPWASKATVSSILNRGGATQSAKVYPVKEFDPAAEKKDGFHILFDGKDMDQWTGNTRDYTIEYGEMVINPSKGSGGNLYTKEEYSDFIFRFEFKLSPGANNGLGVRTPLQGDAAYQGIEIQILDNDAEKYKYLKPYQYHGSLYGIMAAKKGFLNPVGMWNFQEVQVKGDSFKVILNGNVILDGSIADAKLNGTLDSKEHPGLFRESGHIAFLGHGSQVYFRNIRVKKL